MKKTNAMRLLENAGIAFEIREYDVADGRLDAVSAAQKMGEAVDRVYKTLVAVANDREYCVFVVPAEHTLNLKKAAHAAGKKSIEMLPSKQLMPLTGYVHGGCSPVGMKKQFPTWIDISAADKDYFCVSAGKIGCNMAINPGELSRFINADFAELCDEV